MKNITEAFEHVYLPEKALVLYGSVADTDNVYIEAFDMDVHGRPINAHPLSQSEIAELAKRLNASSDVRSDFLQSKGLLPANALYISHREGYALWHTPAQKVKLFFKQELSIPSGEAHIPAMLWKATKDSLEVYVLKTNRKPDMKTVLYHAHYFNIYESGTVCMGTVDIDIDRDCCLEKFMSLWERYFLDSYFSHLIDNYAPVQGNIVQLWQGLVNTGKQFPMSVLIKNGKTVKDLIV